MIITTSVLIHFSPTGTTRKITKAIASGMGFSQAQLCDLTTPEALKSLCPLPLQSLVILGVPVYAGRVPAVARERLKLLHGKGRPAILIVTYGNRAYEDALLELRDLALEGDFSPIAGGAFIGEHSFSTSETPIAEGRPDAQDLQLARYFGVDVRKRLEGASSLKEIPMLEVPGNTPYRQAPARGPRAPVTDAALCVKCGGCVSVCPVAAVELNEKLTTDTARCIFCCACVKNCPKGARKVANPEVLQFVKQLQQRCHTRKEPELFHCLQEM